MHRLQFREIEVMSAERYETINLDFGQRVVIETDDRAWQASPMQGVLRKPLAREEAERGHATSVVRYEPQSRFSEHGHPLGEEILVLEGTFSDATGDFHAGTYFRNPDGFRHAPFSEEGTVILVKLHQFQSGDDAHVVIDTTTAEWEPGHGGIEIMPLHSFRGERVVLERWSAGASLERHVHEGGEEAFVISGEFIDELGRYPSGTWIRSPHLSAHQPYVEQDTLLWVKTGHLPPD
jgi:anti-sigma factor ChrR (cupin superfamily)